MVKVWPSPSFKSPLSPTLRVSGAALGAGSQQCLSLAESLKEKQREISQKVFRGGTSDQLFN